MLTIKKTIGNFGEELARNFLIRHGYALLSGNTKVGRKEIDIVAKISDKIIFVEVKTLAGRQDIPAEDALSRRQIETIKKAVQIYCRINLIPLISTRLDLISINLHRQRGTAKLRHYKNIC